MAFRFVTWSAVAFLYIFENFYKQRFVFLYFIKCEPTSFLKKDIEGVARSISLVFGPQALEGASLELVHVQCISYKKRRRSPVFRQSSQRYSATYKFKETPSRRRPTGINDEEHLDRGILDCSHCSCVAHCAFLVKPTSLPLSGTRPTMTTTTATSGGSI